MQADEPELSNQYTIVQTDDHLSQQLDNRSTLGAGILATGHGWRDADPNFLPLSTLTRSLSAPWYTSGY
jgi:hypothetical protein